MYAVGIGYRLPESCRPFRKSRLFNKRPFSEQQTMFDRRLARWEPH